MKKRIIAVILTLCMLITLSVFANKAYCIIPNTTLLFRGVVWTIQNDGPGTGGNKFTRNGVPIDILHTDSATDTEIDILCGSTREYLRLNNLPGLSGGTVDLNPYDLRYLYKNTTKTAQTTTQTTTTQKAETKCEHSYKEEITTEPTCKDKGVKTFTCEKCKKSYTEEIPVTEEHTFKEEIEKEPTCTEEGISAKVCEICDYKEETPIDKLTHSYKEEVTKEPACTEKGTNTFTCELCGDTYNEDIEPLGHKEGEFTVTIENTLFSEGEQVKKCSVCDEILQKEVIPSKFQIFINGFMNKQ